MLTDQKSNHIVSQRRRPFTPCKAAFSYTPAYGIFSLLYDCLGKIAKLIYLRTHDSRTYGYCLELFYYVHVN